MNQVPVIDLSKVPLEISAWGKPRFYVYLWSIFELIFVTNPWQISSRVRVLVLRLFGAKIGQRVIFRTRTRVKFPWNLTIGDRCWIGEGVWFHNQAQISLGSDVVISQETMLTTGSHAYRGNMELKTKEIEIQDGVWVTSRCLIIGGSKIQTSSLILPMSLVNGGTVPSGEIWGGNPAVKQGIRFIA